MMSRATIIDERKDEDEGQVEAFDQQDEVEAQPEEAEQPQQDPLPEKYQGKSLEEVVRMHQEAEKALGKQSSEVGELRQIVDNHIQAQLAQEQAPVQQQDEGDDVDFFIDPRSAVSKAIENHPKIKEAEAYAQQSKKQATLSQLQSEFPDMENTLKDPQFAEWIKASKIRTQLFVQADQYYDYDAATELFQNWRERNRMVKQTVEVEKQARKQQVKTASTGNARGTGETVRKKTYRRADIIKLMKTDPERYQAISDEIFAAYAEGRVK